MNDTAHLMAIIEDKLAQARASLRHGDPVRAEDLMAQVGIYAQSLGRRNSSVGPEPLRPGACAKPDR